MHNFFIELTLIIALAAILSIVFKFLKQPPILAYILTGIIAAQFLIITPENRHSFKSLSEIGITLLLFILGIEIKIGNLRSVGKVALITGVGQIIFTTIIGFLICQLLGFTAIVSLYISFAITFSSTIVIVKLLADKKDLNSLYGKISIGFLLVQDFSAIIALILLSSLNAGGSLNPVDVALIFVKAVFLVCLILLMSKYIFPALVHHLSRSNEILFVSSLAWAFGLAVLVSSPFIGFSIEIGGFLAGLALANSVESSQIISKVRSLRDFFIVIFFVILGTNLSLNDLGSIIIPSLLLSAFVLIGKPIIVLLLLRYLKYKIRTGLLSGLAVAQVSEFSLILVILGQTLGHLDQTVVSTITLIGIITFVFSTYMILNGDRIHKMLKPILKKIDPKKNVERRFKAEHELEGHFVLIGAHRMGQTVLESLKEETENILIIDFNPDVVQDLNKKGYKAIFGDIIDDDIQEAANIDKAKVVFSTVSDFEDNLILCNNIRKLNKNIQLILTAHSIEDKQDLLRAGADIVVMPYTVAGKSIAKAINSENWKLLK
jgi:Kef-type K+ transport system membrane component KefB